VVVPDLVVRITKNPTVSDGGLCLSPARSDDLQESSDRSPHRQHHAIANVAGEEVGEAATPAAPLQHSVMALDRPMLIIFSARVYASVSRHLRSPLPR
jgi:hypothetical protein